MESTTLLGKSEKEHEFTRSDFLALVKKAATAPVRKSDLKAKQTSAGPHLGGYSGTNTRQDKTANTSG
jgi:hypothetical protein